MSEDVVLLPEVQARRILGERPIHLRVLAPYGSWTGSGALRVLRMTLLPARGDGVDGDVELVVGYEAYHP